MPLTHKLMAKIFSKKQFLAGKKVLKNHNPV
jgi:hypothetical protein